MRQGDDNDDLAEIQAVALPGVTTRRRDPRAARDGAVAVPGVRGRPCTTASYKPSITSTMISVNIDRSESVPLHDQVAAEIRRAIAEGEAGPGERLPLAKDLAAVLGVNKNTVLRALHLLREEGLLEFRRGRCTSRRSGQAGAARRRVGPRSPTPTSAESPSGRDPCGS